MFRSLSLREALQRLATPDEWQEYEDLCQHGYDGPFVIFTDSASPYERSCTRFRELEGTLWARLQENLLNGTWIAEGFIPPHGSQPQLIHSQLWRVLERDWNLAGVTGSGIRFVNLLISQAVPASATGEQRDKGGLRRQLTQWIEREAKASAGPIVKAALLVRARRSFKGKAITANLFAEAWRSADLPEEARHKGRPRK